MSICENPECGKKFKPSRNSLGKYCSNKCQKRHQRPPFEELKSPTTIRARFIEYYGYYCHGGGCGISEWKDQKIILDLDHKDGNHENRAIENLRLLCPNCHSQTETYKNKNRGNGRYLRRLRYSDGKSY